MNWQEVVHEVDEAAPGTFTFGGVEPVLQVEPGTQLSTTTLDCFGGLVRRASDLPSQVCDPRFLNPQTGPFHVAGAMPGDTLAAHFVSVEPRHGFGVSATIPFFGALTSTTDTATLQAALPERTWVYELDVEARTVWFAGTDSDLRLPLPMDPMHGTVGVAPPLGEVRSSLTPGSWGGNMDTPEMRAGATCYLGVNTPGAGFSFGDGHARQGEGESCGVAVECSMSTTVRLGLVPDVPTPWPRIEDDDFWMTTGSAKPLEDAFRIAHTQMVHWLVDLLDVSALDAYQLVAQTALTPVANVCDTVYTVVCKVPKRFFPGVEAMGGMHGRLRAG